MSKFGELFGEAQNNVFGMLRQFPVLMNFD